MLFPAAGQNQKTSSVREKVLVDDHKNFVRNNYENSLRVRVRNEVDLSKKRTNRNKANEPQGTKAEFDRETGQE